MERNIYSDYERPSYNIKAVAQMVGLLPVTLRAWERRYGLPVPTRGGQGYRLYSEHDVQTLRWLKAQIDSGMNIGQAARKLTQLREAGIDPASNEMGHTEKTFSMENLKDNVSQSLQHLNEKTAADTLRQAFSVYPVDQVFAELVEPVMVEIGEAWHKKELAVGVEHFATHFFLEQLMSMQAVTPLPFRNGVVVAGCMPGEFHQLGLLMLTVLLRMRGWNVIYLGADLSFERLDELLSSLRPRLILLSSTTTESAIHIEDIPSLLQKLPPPIPHVVLGGKGFVGFQANLDFPYLILTDSLDQVVRKLENLLETNLL
jgi:DNA-binding transcriptional MerR regulator